MTGIIILVMLSILTMIALSFEVKRKENSYGDELKDYDIKFKFKGKSLLGLCWILLVVFNCFAIIPANNVAIMYNPFDGGVQNETLTEGFKTKSPLTEVYTLSTMVEELEFKDLSVQTQDSQWLNTVIKIQVRIDRNKAFEYFKKYRNKDLDKISSIINNTLKKELETISTQYNIIDILGESRSEVVNKSTERVKEELLKDGILVERLILVDTDAGDAIEKAISDEAIAKKAVDTAKYAKEQAELEGQAKVIAAQKEKEANELLSKTLTKEILLEKYITAWEKGGSQVPKVTSDDFMINIGDLLN